MPIVDSRRHALPVDSRLEPYLHYTSLFLYPGKPLGLLSCFCTKAYGDSLRYLEAVSEAASLPSTEHVVFLELRLPSRGKLGLTKPFQMFPCMQSSYT